MIYKLKLLDYIKDNSTTIRNIELRNLKNHLE